jgi:hypothetical protein
MSELVFFHDATGPDDCRGDDPRRCDRCGRGPEPTANIDNSGNQFTTISCACGA